MNDYEQAAYSELVRWKLKLEKSPPILDRFAKKIQTKVNSLIPEKAHQLITTTIKQLVRTTLIGSEFTSKAPIRHGLSLEEREKIYLDTLRIYKKTAAVEGAGTGAGGLLLGLSDFPLLLGIKMKFLFDTAGIYGFDVKDIRERLYILYIFQLAFSSKIQQRLVLKKIINWEETIAALPSEPDLDMVDWRTFQQEYRDYLDLAKLLQLVPGIGAVVGAYANYRLLDRLGDTAKNCYRLRILG